MNGYDGHKERHDAHSEQSARCLSRQPLTQFEVEARVVDGSSEANAWESVDHEVDLGPLTMHHEQPAQTHSSHLSYLVGAQILSVANEAEAGDVGTTTRAVHAASVRGEEMPTIKQ